MRVSVVIPAYNAAGTLDEAVTSLLAQTYPDWEAIVVDDGSSDESAEIAEAWAARDRRVRVVRQAHAGAAAARNAGLRLAGGEWLLFLDADDWILPPTLERLAAVVAADPALDAVHCGWARVLPDGSILEEERCPTSGDMFAEFARRCAVVIHSCLVRRSLVQALGGFDPSFKILQDWDLWQRVARTGARFGAIPDSLARYRTSPGSLSTDGRRLLLGEALRIVDIGYSSDPRVPEPAASHAGGLRGEPPAELKYNHLCWSAGLVLGQGGDARPLLQESPSTNGAELDAGEVAMLLFRGACIAAGRAFAAWRELLPRVAEPLDRFLAALEEQAEVPALSRRVRAALERRALEHAPPGEPWTLGATHAVAIEVTSPIPDLRPPRGAERLHATVTLSGERVGTVLLPVCDGLVPSGVLADAIAAEYAWPILGSFLERSVHPDLEIRRSGGVASVWRHGQCLAEGLTEGELTSPPRLHDRIGWTLFLQELWGRPAWPTGRFYDATAGDEPTATCRQGATGRISVEISRQLPAVECAGEACEVEYTVGGSALATLTLPCVEGRIGAQSLQVAITTAAGFELCRAAVREGLLGRPPTGEGDLRRRLAARAEGREAAPARASSATGEPDIVLARRPGPLGGSSSRRAALPWGARAELLAAAAAAGEPVLGTARADEPCGRIVYEPEACWCSPGLPPEAEVRPGGRPPHPTPSRAFDRHHFESQFASRRDPWSYTSNYEEIKYTRTLDLLPAGPIDRALELACAEGHFTRRLADRVGSLIAADISEVALRRAAARCADRSNVRFVRLDLTRDALPRGVDLIVCSEVLYFVGSEEELAAVGRRLRDALEPGGHLLLAHANVLVDEPEETGFDWDVPFGAKVIGETLAGVPGLALVKELWTPLYRIHLFRREDTPGIVPEPVEREVAPATELPVPRIAAHIRWKGEGAGVRPAPAAPAATHRLPILLYHRVAPAGSPARARYRVTPEAFEAQLRYLSQAGFYGVGIEEWEATARQRRPLPGRAVLLTFDDGYRDFLLHAWPLLQRYGFPATVFLVADRVGQTNEWDARYGEIVPLLDWDEVRRLRDAGVRFGSHSATHPHLTALSPAEVAREAARSRDILQRGLGLPVSAFAFPYGDVDPMVEHLVGGCGYLFGFTCRPDPAELHESLLRLPRIEVSGADGLEDFIAKLHV